MIHKTEDNKLKTETTSARNLQQGQANSIMFTSFHYALFYHAECIARSGPPGILLTDVGLHQTFTQLF